MTCQSFPELSEGVTTVKSTDFFSVLTTTSGAIYWL